MEKFSEIDLVGFAHFAINIKVLFKEENFIIDYVSVGAANHICVASKTKGIEVCFYNPTGGEEDFKSAAQTIDLFSKSIQVEFYFETFNGGVYANVPLSAFDDDDFTTMLKSIIGAVPLVPYGEQDPQKLNEISKKWLLTEIENIGLGEFVKPTK